MGTSGMEAGFCVAVGPGDVVDIAGLTNGSLFGTNQGSYDPFLVQFTPEPATLTLLALGGLFLLRRRKRNAWKAVGNDGL
jgi:hypothetical protein